MSLVVMSLETKILVGNCEKLVKVCNLLKWSKQHLVYFDSSRFFKIKDFFDTPCVAIINN